VLNLFIYALVVKKQEDPDRKGKAENGKSVCRCQNYAKYIYSFSFVNVMLNVICSVSFVNIMVLINDLVHKSTIAMCNK
jgi:hypothetical protein